MLGRVAIAEAIAAAGIDTIFTVAGGHFLPTYHELGRHGAIRMVAARHELGAGYMASGYALTKGRPGVVFSGAPGPGATNLVTAIANAYADSIPLLVLTAQVDQRYVRRNILQYCDNVALLAPFCKQSAQVPTIEEFPAMLAGALQLAVAGRPGPVHICLPQNLQTAQIDALSAPAVAPHTPACVEADVIEAIAAALNGAERPAILAGHGVLRAGASEALCTLAKRIGAPVATSRSGIGSVRSSNPAGVGMLGFYGPESARDAVAGADTVLIVGCALGEQTTFGWRKTLFAEGARLIQVDIDASQLNRSYALDLGVTGDAGAVLRALNRTDLTARDGWFDRRPHRHAPTNDPARGLSAASVLQALNAHLPADVPVSADIGNHRLWVCEQLNVEAPAGLLQSCEFDAMGFSLPAALGASVAAAGGKVVSISGDGGYVHTMGELAVAREAGLPVVAIVFVEGALGILKHQAEGFWGEHHSVCLQPIDFAAAAGAFGVAARSVREAAQLDEAIAWAMASDEPVLLEVHIDPEEVFPPLLTKIEQRRIDLLGKAG